MTLATSFKRQALLKMLSHIKYGELKLKLPDGCTHKFTGSQKGPTADMVLLSEVQSLGSWAMARWAFVKRSCLAKLTVTI